MNRFLPFSVSILILIAGIPLSHAGWSDYLDVLKGATGEGGEQAAVTTPAAALSNSEMVGGLKEALQNGVRSAIEKLGTENGFLGNERVRIPMPDSLTWVEKSLRTLRQDRLADEFVASMNHAAEQAVPQAAEIFGDAISQMTVEDAQSILKGPDDAATQYFRTNTEAALTERMLPIVKQATGNTGVTSAYKGMMSKAGGLTSLGGYCKAWAMSPGGERIYAKPGFGGNLRAFTVDPGGTLSTLSIVRFRRGEMEEAVRAGTAARGLAEELGDRSLSAQLLGNLAVFERARGGFRRSIEMFEV